MWKNYEELEENLSLAELNQTLDAARKAKHEQNKFLAAIQGIDLDKNSKNNEVPSFEEMQRRAKAKIHGMTEEQIDLAEVGIQIEEWEDETA